MSRLHSKASREQFIPGLILDAGCGVYPRGDVNVDLYIKKTEHRERGTLIINTKLISNFIVGDVNQLPFRNKIFTESVCRHVLEHRGINPEKVLKELIRVSSHKVEVIVPHHFLCFGQKLFRIHGHENVLTPRRFHKILLNIPHYIELIQWQFVGIRWGKLPIYMPNEIRVIIIPKDTLNN